MRLWLRWRDPTTAPTADELLTYRDWLVERGDALATQRVRLSAVLAFCRWLHRRGELSEDITVDVPVPYELAREVIPLEDLELQALWNGGDMPDRVIVLLLLETGMRCAELCTLQWRDLAEDGALRIEGKGRRLRTVFCLPQTQMVLSLWRRRRAPASDEETLLGLSPSGVRRRLARLAERVGLRRVSPHLLRHTSLTYHAEHATNLDAVRALAGHSRITTTARYLHAGRRSVQRAQEQAGLVARLTNGGLESDDA